MIFKKWTTFLKIEIDGKKYDTVEIPRPAPPYVTLEILSRDKNLCKGVHVITFAHKKVIKLGRGHDSDNLYIIKT